uniref:Uncharacterized protein n=1 Tax=Mesocestoides corti TaxID=53468 RepID=A0A5K3FCI9_MESCO
EDLCNRQGFIDQSQARTTHQAPLIESSTLGTPLIICCSSFMSFSSWLPIFLASHWIVGR